MPMYCGPKGCCLTWAVVTPTDCLMHWLDHLTFLTVLRLCVTWPALSAGQCHLQKCRKAQWTISETDFDVMKQNRLYRCTSKVKFTDTDTHVKCFCWPYYGLVVNWLGSCEWATTLKPGSADLERCGQNMARAETAHSLWLGNYTGC